MSPEVNVCRDSWLFAVALAANVEIATGSLSDRASEAAFAMATNITSTEAHTRPAEEEVVDKDSELERLPWDAPEVPLPKTLSFILKGVLEGKRRLEVRSVLEPVADYSEIPRAPPHNNYRADAKRELDKLIRSWSNAQLNVLRLLAHAYQLGQSGVGHADSGYRPGPRRE